MQDQTHLMGKAWRVLQGFVFQYWATHWEDLNVHKVLRVEDHKWDMPKVQRSGMLSCLFLISRWLLFIDKVDIVSATKIDTVEAWLKTMNLEEYWPVFKEHGFDDLESISDLNETRLGMLGITKEGHRIRLLRKAKEWANV